MLRSILKLSLTLNASKIARVVELVTYQLISFLSIKVQFIFVPVIRVGGSWNVYQFSVEKAP
jgi:hypothetical protein